MARLRRKEAKLTQEELSRKSGVSLGSLKRLETKGKISLESLIKIAFALGYEKDFSICHLSLPLEKKFFSQITCLLKGYMGFLTTACLMEVVERLT